MRARRREGGREHPVAVEDPGVVVVADVGLDARHHLGRGPGRHPEAPVVEGLALARAPVGLEGQGDPAVGVVGGLDVGRHERLVRALGPRVDVLVPRAARVEAVLLEGPVP